MSESGFPEAGRPGEQPKITKLADFSAEALGQLVQYLNGALEVPLNQIIGYKQQTQMTRASLAAAISVAGSTNTTINWDGEEFDFGELHDLSTNPNRITIKSDGKYLAGALGVFAANATGDRAMWIRRNGTTVEIDERRACAALDTACQVVTALDLRAGDYLDVQVYQSSGGALNLNAGVFWVARITT